MAFAIGRSSSKNTMEMTPPTNSKTAKFSALIVDDDPLIQRIHKAFLSRFGFHTQVAANGKEAVDLYLAGASFHLVLMDMEMPIMDGQKATRELRSMGASCLIVGLTSRDNGSDKRAFMAAGLDECHAKPLTTDKTKSLVQLLKKNH